MALVLRSKCMSSFALSLSLTVTQESCVQIILAQVDHNAAVLSLLDKFIAS
jgi:hypothetical protein